MRVKLTAKHPRPASSERAPVRTGSTSARKPTRPVGPKPSSSTAGFSGARGEGAGKTAGGGKRPAGGKPAGAGARAPRAEGSFSRERDAGGPRRTTSDRPPRREGAGGAPRRFEGSGERAPRRAEGERAPRRFEGAGDRGERAPRRFEGAGDRGERAPRRFEGTGDRAERAPRRFEGAADRTERAPRRFEGTGDRAERAPRRFEGAADRTERPPRRFEGAGDRGERAPRRFEGAGDRTDRPPRRFESTGDRAERAPRRFEGADNRTDRAPRSVEGNRAPRRDDGERRSFTGPRPGAGRPSEGGPRGERPARREHEGADRPRFGSDRGAPQERRSGGERAPRSDSAPRRFEGERGSSERGERGFAKPVKSGYGDRSDRPARAPRDDRGERAPAKREFGDRPARTGERGERAERPARSVDKTLPAASRRFGDDHRPARADKPRGTAPATRTKRNPEMDAAPRTPRRDYEDAPGTLRLSKLMSELGLCSRREADEWIEKGWVLVDGERIDTLGTKVRPDQRIEIDPAAEAAQASQVTVLVHKTVGFVSGQAEDGYQPAITLVTPENRWEGDRSAIRFSVAHLRQLAPAGRLDIDSTGLLVLTQDGRIAKQLIGGHSEIDKEYLVRVSYGEHTTDVESHFPPESLALLRHGLSLDDVPLKPAQVSWQNGEQLRFVLREGKKRQIRRMCELVGLEVVGLKRVRMGRVTLGALPPGQWRYLSPDESF
ncbi:pseudouridine synthase [Paraburkholderia terricola]|uniref:pseudouridine synthase n=1 Tax=Paraburkholderia terricola TaxID=169427 RepID=UPI000936F2F9|nr:pseudouridine synthase [Paraburkholderia terricola]